MKRLIFLVAVVVCLTSPAAGGMRRPIVRGRMQRAEPRTQKITADNRVTVAPFAVPVAVPVATVARPTLFYRYGEYLSPPVAAPAASPTDPAENGVSSATLPDERATPPDRAATKAASAETVVTGDEAAFKILAQHCAKCHSGPLAKGGKQFFDGEGRMFARLPRHVMLEMVEPNEAGKQRMPPGELPKLTEEDIKVLRHWARLPRDAVY